MSTYQYDRQLFNAHCQAFLANNCIEGSDLGRFAAIRQDHRANFIACLFWRVLADQAVHNHFPEQHPAFEHVTSYPKMSGGLAAGYPDHILAGADRSVGPVERGEVSLADLQQAVASAMTLMCAEYHVISLLHQTPTFPNFRHALENDTHVLRWANDPNPILRFTHAALAAALAQYA